jgi:hypothetical protein
MIAEAESVGKRGDRKAAKQRARDGERQRRQTAGSRRQPEAGPSLRFHPNGRPDFSELPWGDLSASDARKLKRAMLIAYIGDRAPISSVDPINLAVVAVVPSLVALPDDPVVFGRVGLPQERHSVVVHRDGAVGGDVDFLAILHGVEEVAAELVDGDDLGVVPDVSEDDARC